MPPLDWLFEDYQCYVTPLGIRWTDPLALNPKKEQLQSRPQDASDWARTGLLMRPAPTVSGQQLLRLRFKYGRLKPEDDECTAEQMQRTSALPREDDAIAFPDSLFCN